MDLQGDKDYFETYLEYFPDVPSLVLIRSVELKNFPVDYLKPPILDLCCGDGFFANALGLRNAKGCDISEKAIKLAEEKGIYEDLQVCDARNLPYENNSFNTVISNCALEHVEGIDIALQEVSRVLNRGGYLIITVPSELLVNEFPPKIVLESIKLYKLGRKILDAYNRKQAIYNILSLNQWEKLLSSVGLNIIKHFYLFDKRSYKIAILCDWLLTLSSFNIINRFFRLVLPPHIRKVFWRKLLKKYHLSSKPLNEGGELVIIAKNEK